MPAWSIAYSPVEQVVLMGPTGAPVELPRNETILVIAGRWGAAVMLDIGPALRAAGNQVLYVGAFASAKEVDYQAALEEGADQIIWAVAKGPEIGVHREQDRSVVATDMVELLRAYSAGELGAGCYRAGSD